ncbi:MAG: hypothetical protein R3C03_17825 [Pirellulaceae bacterium]
MSEQLKAVGIVPVNEGDFSLSGSITETDFGFNVSYKLIARGGGVLVDSQVEGRNEVVSAPEDVDLLAGLTRSNQRIAFQNKRLLDELSKKASSDNNGQHRIQQILEDAAALREFETAVFASVDGTKLVLDHTGYTIEILKVGDGNRSVFLKPEMRDDGEYYVNLNAGDRYSILLTNSNQDIALARVTIDGVNTFANRRDGGDTNGFWALSGGKSGSINGWFKTTSKMRHSN